MGGKKYRIRDVNDLADEFEYIINEMPEIQEIFLEDDTFTVNQKRTVEFCDELIRRGINVAWSCNNGLTLAMRQWQR